MNQPKRILICPLNWGLGHATRCIPVIRLLLKKNAEVIIAADGRPLDLLKQEFPQLEFVYLKGYDINYPGNGSMTRKMFFSIPKILKGIKTEHETLKQIIKEKRIDVIISDNRFGLWNKDITSIFITHQLIIKTPFAEKLLHHFNLKYIKKYSECWIPDVKASDNLSGDLSHKYKLPDHAFFIGALSRFDQFNNRKDFSTPFEMTSKYDVMAIISGPEPQRTIFQNLIIEQLQKTNIKSLVVCGITEIRSDKKVKGMMEIVNHLNTNEMQDAILSSKIIIARSGYSTIMDLAALGKKAVFIPTPGQTEQEYLAKLLMQKKIAYFQTQFEFNLNNALVTSESYTGFGSVVKNKELEKRIDRLMNS